MSRYIENNFFFQIQIESCPNWISHTLRGHIFSKAQVTSNKNAHNFRHHFWAQFLMLFSLAWSILFGVLAWETTFSLVEILQQPIRSFHLKVSKANTPNKMDHTRWKSIINCGQKWCRKLFAFLFVATWAFGKMWGLNLPWWYCFLILQWLVLKVKKHREMLQHCSQSPEPFFRG